MKGTPLTLWNVKFSWGKGGVILSPIHSPKITYSCNTKFVIYFLRNTSTVMREGNSQLAPDEISQHEHQVIRCCQWLKSCTSLLLIMGSSIPGGWRLQKARFSSVMKRRDIFRRRHQPPCVGGRRVSAWWEDWYRLTYWSWKLKGFDTKRWDCEKGLVAVNTYKPSNTRNSCF